MTKLYYVPIEPLEERYTKQWYDNFPVDFRDAGYDVEVIDGTPLSNHVGVGTFLDINSTIAYKNSQFIKIASLFHNGQVKDGSIFFFGDMEFWGLESLRLMADMNKVKIRIYAFLHAASYTIQDAFAIAEPYQQYTEIGWAVACDGIFVGSQYHKDAFYSRRVAPLALTKQKNEIRNKIVVTGNPLFSNEFPEFSSKKRNQIIISNRFDWEKRPNLSLDFAIVLKRKHPDWKIIVTTSRKEFKSNKQWLVDYARALEEAGVISVYSGLTKYEYYKALAESKVMLSNSIEENFGYCIAEALVYNTYPMLRNALSHPELVEDDPRLLFNDEDEIVSKIERLMGSTFDVTKYATKYINTPMEKMLEKMTKDQ
jgi:glycosyltransferase involved in cell wall biosynthesis